MTSPKKSSSNVYETIGNHIDERLKKSTTVIGGIRGNLFDLLTLGGDDSSKEIGEKIKQEIDAKIKAAEDKIFLKHGNTKEEKKEARKEIKNDKYIQSLKKIRGDLNLRINNNKKSEGDGKNDLLNLDKNQSFNDETLENIADGIINDCHSPKFEGVLLSRLLNADKETKQSLLKKIENKMANMGDLTDNQRKNLEKIIEKLDGEGTYIEKRRKAKLDLKKKIDDMILYGKSKVDITDPVEIEERLNNLTTGDIIFYKSERKTGKRKEGRSIILGTGEPYKIGGERPGMGQIGDRYRVIKKGLNSIELLNISMRDEGYSLNESTIKLSMAKLVSEKDKIEKIWIVNNSKKTVEPKPKQTKPKQTKPEQTRPEQTRPEQTRPEQTRPEQTRPEQTRPEQTKPERTKPEQTRPEPEEDVIFEENAVLSDVGESYEDMISRMVENEINEEWHNTSKFNVFKRGKLFLMRGKMRKRRIEELKKKYEKTPFTSNGTFNREMAKQAARHDLEEILGKKGVTRDAFGKIKRESLVSETEVKLEGRRGKEFKEMCQEYVAGTISQLEFQDRFNKFVKKLGAAVNQKFLATNVLEKLDAIKNDNELLKSITSELEKYISDHNSSHFGTIRAKIDDDFKKYKRDPRFRKEIMEILGNTAGLSKEQLDEKINKFMKHQKALAKASANNLQIKLDLLTNGKGAYQTNNKDRENWLFRFGNKLDKMPRWGQALTVAGISASGMLVGGVVAATGGTAFAAGLAGTATLSGLVGAKNFIKKWTHHTKEQNTYEKNLTRNYEEEIAKMKERGRIMTEKDSEGKYTNGWFKRYKAKRQLELYGKTTQIELQNEATGNTKELSDLIYAGLERYDSLSPDEKNTLNRTLLDAKARLETYWAKGHNFLKSKNKNQIERDFYDLENALNLSANRILGSGATLKDISQIRALDASGNEINYKDLLDSYKKDYNSASKRFRGERAWLATKWGLGTAAITFGTSAAVQAATGTGMFAKDAVPATPGTPESTSTTSTGNITDHYGMGQREGGDNIFEAAKSNIGENTNSVTLHFGAGTDGTPVRAGSSLFDHNKYLAKLAQVKDVIDHSSLSNKIDLSSQLDKGFATSGFTNTDLHGMRCLEAIEETVRGATENGFSGTLNLSYDPIMNIDGTVAYDATSRMSNAILEITNVIPGQPGTDAVEGGAKWLVLGLPRFSNTFKRNNDGNTPERPVEQPVDEPVGKPTDEPTDKTNDKGNNEGRSSTIIIPPVKSDERNEIKEDTDKKEEVTENLKKNVKDDLYKVFHKDDMNNDDFKNKYEDSKFALKRLEEAKDFRKDFPKTNFYDKNIVDELKEKYKENEYILNCINKELRTNLDSQFKHYLEKAEIDKFKDKAKTLVDSALSDKNYARHGIRPMIIINLSDELSIPFYLSTGQGNKPGVPVDKFYPIFGIGTGKKGRLNKGRESEIDNYYGSPLLAAIAKDLNKRYEDKSLKVEDWGSSNSDFVNKANLGKSPVDEGENGYNNINETLKKVSKIKETD